MTIQTILDPSRSLEGWMRKQGWTEEQLGMVRAGIGPWLEAMTLRQLDAEVRREQDLRALRYLARVPDRDLTDSDRAHLVELRIRRGG